MSDVPKFVKISDRKYRCDFKQLMFEVQYTADNSHNWHPNDESPLKSVNSDKRSNFFGIKKSTKVIYCEKCRCNALESDITLNNSTGYYTHKKSDVQKSNFCKVIELLKSDSDDFAIYIMWLPNGGATKVAGINDLEELANYFNQQISIQSK